MRAGSVSSTHPKPVPLETAAGETLFVNWDHVAFVRGETPH
jgi:hypothetical protein